MILNILYIKGLIKKLYKINYLLGSIISKFVFEYVVSPVKYANC